MQFRVITVEREYGSGGANIARKLSEKLGWKLWDQNITAEIARVAKVDPKAAQRCDERVDSLLSRLFRVYARGSYERSLPLQETQEFNTDRMFTILRKVVEDVAAQGQCVIVGRGSPFFLRDRPDVLRIFVYAPLEEKIRRVKLLGKSEQEARKLVEEIDTERAAFIRHYFGKEWPHRPLYHAMLNSQFGDESVVDMVLAEFDIFGKRLPLERERA
ncbi:MAG TPA: cytidylate kinase-like family protein [Candidatus Acidoferrales bacterium]|jgi:cytidylate kinase